MKIYPALKGRIGQDNPLYYVVMMPVKELVKEVDLVQEFLNPQDPSLKDRLQRKLEGKRTRDIIKFFERDDRFISSIVVATIGGNPEFQKIQPKDNQLLPFPGMHESLGSLTFHGGERYYALDGQHRLLALRKAIENSPKIANDEISVILIPGDGEKGLSDYTKKRYRNLFTWLNRYAKPTSTPTNIIMDEEDLFAIVTRRLIEKYPFFSIERVDIEGKAIKPGSHFFTTIEILYEFTLNLLQHSKIDIPENATSVRPSEQVIDDCTTLSINTWDVLRQVIDDLNNKPELMRNIGEVGSNHLLFRPVGQLLLSHSICQLIATNNSNVDHKTPINELKELLAPLSFIDWELKERPWLYVFTTKGEDEHGRTEYKMRHESKKSAHKLPVAISGCILDRNLEQDRLQSLKEIWVRDISRFVSDEKFLKGEWKKVQQSILETRERIERILG